mgnify:CR=1 FL=1
MDTRATLLSKFPYSRVRGSIKSSVVKQLVGAVDSFYGEDLRLREAFLSRSHLFSAHTPWSYFKNHRDFETPMESASRSIVELQLDGYFYCEGFFATENFGAHHAWVCDDKGKGFELHYGDELWRPGSLMVGMVVPVEALHGLYHQGKEDFGLLHAEASTVLGIRALSLPLSSTKTIQMSASEIRVEDSPANPLLSLAP